MKNPFTTFNLWRTRPKRARPELLRRLELLFSKELPYVLNGQYDWQLRYYPHPEMPSIDVVASGLHFSFLPQVVYKLFGLEILPKSRILEESFRRRLVSGDDLVPILPIFLDPRHVLRLKDEALFAVYLDRQWHEAVLWGLRSLPAPPVKNYDSTDPPGSWQSRRAYLEEASRAAFFTVATQEIDL